VIYTIQIYKNFYYDEQYITICLVIGGSLDLFSSGQGFSLPLPDIPSLFS
jgi:hypothetical protein